MNKNGSHFFSPSLSLFFPFIAHTVTRFGLSFPLSIPSSSSYFQTPLGFFCHFIPWYATRSLPWTPTHCKPLDYLSLFFTTELTCQVANSHLENDIYFEFWLTIYITMIRNQYTRAAPSTYNRTYTCRLPLRDPCFTTLERTNPFNNANRNPNYD